MYELKRISNPWILENETFKKTYYEETCNLENIKTHELKFDWWTMTIAIDKYGVCFVMDLWYMQ